jgi:hypothetical protein
MKRFTRFRRRPHTTKGRPASARLEVELLEARNLLDGTPTNVLVNNPAEDTIPKQDTQSETAIVLGANSNIVVAYNDTGAYTPGVNWHLIGYSLSDDGGASFTDQGTLPQNPYGDGTDPVLARSTRTGTIFLSTLTFDTTLSSAASVVEGDHVNVFRSSDNGVTFAAPINGSPGFVPGVDQQDKDWLTVDNFPGPGQGNVYLAWRDYSSNSANNGIMFTRSTDDGRTWGPSGGTFLGAGAVQGADVVVGPDHAVYVFWLSFANNHWNILMRKSTDFGATFGPAVIAVKNLRTSGPNGDLGLIDSSGQVFRTNTFPQVAVNPVSGDLYLVSNDEGNGQDRADIYFTESTDGGAKWSNPTRVNDDTTSNDQWQPAIAVTPDGSHVGIFWYDRRLDPANNLIDRFGVLGTVSGHTVNFEANFRITDVSFPPAFNQDPVWGTSGYMGDYDMAAADNNCFYTTWGDSQLPDAYFANQPDVRFAKIPVTGLESDTALLAPNSTNGAPTASTGTAAVPPPRLGRARLARGGDRLPGDLLAVAAGLVLPFPGQSTPPETATPTLAVRAVLPLAPQGLDPFLAAAGEEDEIWAFAAATRDARDATGDGWGDVLGDGPWRRDATVVFPPAGP